MKHCTQFYTLMVIKLIFILVQECDIIQVIEETGLSQILLVSVQVGRLT